MVAIFKYHDKDFTVKPFLLIYRLLKLKNQPLTFLLKNQKLTPHPLKLSNKIKTYLKKVTELL